MNGSKLDLLSASELRKMTLDHQELLKQTAELSSIYDKILIPIEAESELDPDERMFALRANMGQYIVLPDTKFLTFEQLKNLEQVTYVFFAQMVNGEDLDFYKAGQVCVALSEIVARQKVKEFTEICQKYLDDLEKSKSQPEIQRVLTEMITALTRKPDVEGFEKCQKIILQSMSTFSDNKDDNIVTSLLNYLCYFFLNIAAALGLIQQSPADEFKESLNKFF